MSDMLDRKLLEKWIDDNYYEETDGECESSGLIIEVPALLKAIQSGSLSPQDNTRQQEGLVAESLRELLYLTEHQISMCRAQHGVTHRFEGDGAATGCKWCIAVAKAKSALAILPSPPTKQEPPHDHT